MTLLLLLALFVGGALVLWLGAWAHDAIARRHGAALKRWWNQ